MRLRFVLALLTLLAAGCTRHTVPPPLAVVPPAPRATDLPRVGRFAGLLPCSDCGGVQTELTLAGDWDGRYLFQMTETHVGGPHANQTMQSAGRWTTLRGTTTDRSAVVYHLDPDPPTPSRSFVVVDERHIRLLGPDLEPLPASVSATLTRVDGR